VFQVDLFTVSMPKQSCKETENNPSVNLPFSNSIDICFHITDSKNMMFEEGYFSTPFQSLHFLRNDSVVSGMYYLYYYLQSKGGVL